MTTKKSYHELIQIPSIEDRFNYLDLCGIVGSETFGFNRYLNQKFYMSDEWKKIRREIILRDNACDMGVEGYEIHHRLQVHHINPITLDDIKMRREEVLLNPDNLICVSARTHNAIHYCDQSLLVSAPIERKPNDTCPWK